MERADLYPLFSRVLVKQINAKGKIMERKIKAGGEGFYVIRLEDVIVIDGFATETWLCLHSEVERIEGE